MKNGLNTDSPFFRMMGRIGDLFLLNFIFVVTSIPVVTIGASLTAFLTVALKMTANKEGYIIRGYLKAFKSNFKQATIMHVLFCVLGAVLLFDLNFWVSRQSAVSAIMIIFSMIPIVIFYMTLLYVYVQQAVFDNRITATVKNALLMAVKNLPVTLLLGLALIAVTYIMYLFGAVRVFMVLYGFGLLGYGMAIIYRYVYREYLDSFYLMEEGMNQDD